MHNLISDVAIIQSAGGFSRLDTDPLILVVGFLPIFIWAVPNVYASIGDTWVRGTSSIAHTSIDWIPARFK
jgi:hypothetical protein